MKTRNIGGSILPSSDSWILMPINHANGVLVVVPMRELDTHHLVFRRDGVETILASHPNGYSCRSLAKIIQSGHLRRMVSQVDYITACGGTSLSVNEIIAKTNTNTP